MRDRSFYSRRCSVTRSDGASVGGVRDIREMWPPFFTWQEQGASFEIVSLDVTAGNDVAFAYALLRCGPQEELDRDPDNRLRLTVGLRKESGRWLVAHEHHSFPYKDEGIGAGPPPRLGTFSRGAKSSTDGLESSLGRSFGCVLPRPESGARSSCCLRHLPEAHPEARSIKARKVATSDLNAARPLLVPDIHVRGRRSSNFLSIWT
jgi:ketosteroid isomerase-like protein